VQSVIAASAPDLLAGRRPDRSSRWRAKRRHRSRSHPASTVAESVTRVLEPFVSTGTDQATLQGMHKPLSPSVQQRKRDLDPPLASVRMAPAESLRPAAWTRTFPSAERSSCHPCHPNDQGASGLTWVFGGSESPAPAPRRARRRRAGSARMTGADSPAASPGAVSRRTQPHTTHSSSD